MVGKAERNKDLLQDIVEGTARRVGSIATIIATAVVDVSKEIGGLVTDGFEMREAQKLAEADERRQLEVQQHQVEEEKLHADEHDEESDDDDADEQY